MFITLWQFNIAIENTPFIVDFLIKNVIFHSYVNVYQRVCYVIINPRHHVDISQHSISTTLSRKRLT